MNNSRFSVFFFVIFLKTDSWIYCTRALSNESAKWQPEANKKHGRYQEVESRGREFHKRIQQDERHKRKHDNKNKRKQKKAKNRVPPKQTRKIFYQGLMHKHICGCERLKKLTGTIEHLGLKGGNWREEVKERQTGNIAVFSRDVHNKAKKYLSIFLGFYRQEDIKTPQEKFTHKRRVHKNIHINQKITNC